MTQNESVVLRLNVPTHDRARISLILVDNFGFRLPAAVIGSTEIEIKNIPPQVAQEISKRFPENIVHANF